METHLIVSGSGSYKEDLTLILPFWWPALLPLWGISGVIKGRLFPKERTGFKMSPSVLQVHKQQQHRQAWSCWCYFRRGGAEGLTGETQSARQVDRLFKCFKMQITTGFKFSLSLLVKTKVKAGLPRSHRAAVCFSGAWPRWRQLRKGWSCWWPPSQINRASWGTRRTDSVATRVGSWMPRLEVGWRGQGDARHRCQGGRCSGNQALHPMGLKKARGRAAQWLITPPVMVSWGKEETRQRLVWPGRKDSPPYKMARACQVLKRQRLKAWLPLCAQQWLFGQKMPSERCASLQNSLVFVLLEVLALAWCGEEGGQV